MSDSNLSSNFDADLSSVDLGDVPGLGDTSQAASTTPAPEVIEADNPDVQEHKEATSEDDEGSAADAAPSKAVAPAAVLAPREVKFKAGDVQQALPETAIVEWRVDGKKTPVTVRELLDNYSGKVAYDKRFTDLAHQRKSFTGEATEFEQTKSRYTNLINDMHKNATQGNLYAAVSNMLEMSGAKIDAKQYITNLRNALIEQAQQLSQMTPDQRQMWEEREALEYERNRLDRTRQQFAQDQSQAEFQVRVNKAIETAGINHDEYVQQRDWLLQDAKKRGVDPLQITPEVVTNQAVATRDYRAVKEAMEEIDPELVKNTSLWDQVVILKRANPAWSHDDLVEIFQNAVDTKRSRTVSKKIAQAPVATAAKGAVKGKQKPQTASSDPRDYTSFNEDDLRW